MPHPDHSAQSLSEEQASYQRLLKTAPQLILRGMVISSFQFFIKSAVYAQADELATYGIFSEIEELIFLLIFRGVRVISRNAAHLHAEELKNESAFDPKKLGRLYRQGVFFGLLLMGMAGILSSGAPAFFRFTKQSNKTIEKDVHIYFFYLFFACLGDMLFRSRVRVDIGRSETLNPLLGDICESVIDALGTYVLVSGKWGFPKMGVSGGALAYAISTVITAFFYNLQSYFNPALEKYQLYDFSQSNIKEALFDATGEYSFKKMVIDGLHITAKYSILYGTTALTTVLCNLKGKGSLVGLQAAKVYSKLILLPIGGFSQAINTEVGRLFKSDDFENAKKIGNYAITRSCLFASISAMLLFTFANPIARLFMSDDAAHQPDFEIVKNFLCIQGIMGIINSVEEVGASVLSACNDTESPFYFNLGFTLLLNTAFVSASHFVFEQDALRLYSIQLIGMLLTSGGILWRWSKQGPAQKNPTPTETHEPAPVVVIPVIQTLWRQPEIAGSSHSRTVELSTNHISPNRQE